MRRRLNGGEAVSRLWRIDLGPVHSIERSALRTHEGVDPEGKAVRFHSPPDDPLPFSYAFVRSRYPFLVTVTYGWATKGQNTAFGQGGERLVFSVFGLWSRVIKNEDHWYF